MQMNLKVLRLRTRGCPVQLYGKLRSSKSCSPSLLRPILISIRCFQFRSDVAPNVFLLDYYSVLPARPIYAELSCVEWKNSSDPCTNDRISYRHEIPARIFLDPSRKLVELVFLALSVGTASKPIELQASEHRLALRRDPHREEGMHSIAVVSVSQSVVL